MKWFYGRCWFYESWWYQSPFYFVLIYFMFVVSQSCLCIRIFKFYGNQPRSAIDSLLDYTSANEFTQALLLGGMISVGSNYMSPIICSIWCASISCFALTRCILMLRSVMLSLLPATMIFHTDTETMVHLWFSSHAFLKPHINTTNMTINQQRRENTVLPHFPSISNNISA